MSFESPDLPKREVDTLFIRPPSLVDEFGELAGVCCTLQKPVGATPWPGLGTSSGGERQSLIPPFIIHASGTDLSVVRASTKRAAESATCE